MTVASDAFATIPTPPEQSAKATNNGYRFVIPECPANPVTKPLAELRISHEFRRNPKPLPAVVRLRQTAIHTLAAATDRIPVSFLFGTRTAPAAIVPCLCRRWIAAA